MFTVNKKKKNSRHRKQPTPTINIKLLVKKKAIAKSSQEPISVRFAHLVPFAFAYDISLYFKIFFFSPFTERKVKGVAYS